MVPESCEKAVKNRRGKINYGDNSFDTIPELAFFLYVSDVYGSNRITVHPDNPFVYNYNGKTHKYWPDFNVDGIFIEIKGAQFFRDDGTMFCPYRKKDMTDDEYAELCGLYEAKRQCMIMNHVIILSNDEYKPYIEYMKQQYFDLYASIKYHSCKSKQ